MSGLTKTARVAAGAVLHAATRRRFRGNSETSSLKVRLMTHESDDHGTDEGDDGTIRRHGVGEVLEVTGSYAALADVGGCRMRVQSRTDAPLSVGDLVEVTRENGVTFASPVGHGRPRRRIRILAKRHRRSHRRDRL